MSEHPESARAAFQTVVTFLQNDGWNPIVDAEQLVCHLASLGHHGRLDIAVRIDPESEHAIFRVQAPVAVPERARMAVAEFLTRANYGLQIGNFEIDLRDGEVRFKTGYIFEEVGVTPRAVHNHLYAALNGMERYLLGYLAVASGAKNPTQAIRDIEGD